MADTAGPYRLLEWDSGFFGLRIARYSAPAMDEGQARAVRESCRRDGIDCMYFLAGPHDVASLESARALSMRHTGIRLVFRLSPLAPCPADEASRTRPAREDDLPALERLASALHSTSRFFLDPGFDRAKAGELYSIWLEKSFQDPECMLLSAGGPGHPTGYCLARMTSDGTSTLELLGVEPELKGTGLGRALMLSGLGWLRSKGAGEARLVTQGGGPGLVSFYEKAGFTVESVKLWFHYWPALGTLS
jgi:ribosomal protein S18 acetylase RimI-like enzyme